MAIMAALRRYLTINQANLDHGHIYLADCMDLFPPDVVGGANKTVSAPRTVQIDFGSGQVNTDVVRDKRIFRKRGWLRRFFADNSLAPGDRVVLERLGPYSYRVSAEPLELTCLSIQQPWADLILDGQKQIENRNWPWTYAQDLLKAGEKVTLGIHVSSYLSVWRGLTEAQRQHYAQGWNETGISGGVVAGMVDVVRICRWNDLPQHLQRHKFTQKEFAWHWELANPRRLREPVRWPGNTRTFMATIPRRLLPAYLG
jgi:hypothetical protein